MPNIVVIFKVNFFRYILDPQLLSGNTSVEASCRMSLHCRLNDQNEPLPKANTLPSRTLHVAFTNALMAE